MIPFLMALAAVASPVRIAVLGDRTGGPDDAEFTASLEAISAMSPDLMVNVGDLVDGYTEDTDEIGEQWDHVLGMTGAILGDLRFVMVPGNHDITYDAAEPVWRSRTGTAPDRIEEVGGVVFVIWDTSRYDYPDDDCLGRLDSLLALVEPSDTAVLVTHKPFWILWDDEPEALIRLRGAVASADVEAVLGGHIHTYAWERVDGVEYITMGTSGGDFGTESVESGCLPQVGWLTVDGDSVSFALLDPRAVYPRDMNTVAEEELLYRISDGLLTPAPLAGPGPAILELASFEDAERTVEMTVEPGAWGLIPESLSVTLEPLGLSSVAFDANPSGGVFPAPVIHALVPYGDRGKTAVIDTCWPVARYVVAAPCGPGASVDGDAAPGEYAGLPETVFAGEDGSPAATGPMEVLVGYSDGILRFHSTMALGSGCLPEDESFGVVVFGNGACWRIKAFPDGGSNAIIFEGGEVSPWEEGWQSSASGDGGSWQAEIGVDLGSVGADGTGEVRVHMYRFSTDGSATWSWPLDFEESAMGTVAY